MLKMLRVTAFYGSDGICYSDLLLVAGYWWLVLSNGPFDVIVMVVIMYGGVSFCGAKHSSPGRRLGNPGGPTGKVSLGARFHIFG